MDDFIDNIIDNISQLPKVYKLIIAIVISISIFSIGAGIVLFIFKYPITASIILLLCPAVMVCIYLFVQLVRAIYSFFGG